MSKQDIIKNCRPQNFKDIQADFKNCQKVFDVEDIKFPLSTSGIKIVDATGKRVKLAGVNWSGGHLKRQSPSGLDKRPMSQIVHKIRYELKMNCVRLCYSLQMLYDTNPLDTQFIEANPDLKGLTPLQVLDKTIECLTKQGIMVFLNNHTSKSQWCCSGDDGDGLWYNFEYPEHIFFEAAQMMAQKYKNNERVIGSDLRNQIRPNKEAQPEWGTGFKNLDWKMAAQECAQRVLKVAPHWLILVGGLNYQGDFTDVALHPMKLSVPNKLIYTGHLYEWSYWNFNSKNNPKYTYEQFEEQFFSNQTFVRALGVPFLLGQFGVNNENTYWKYLHRYVEERDLDFTYWCLDGSKHCDKGQQDQSYGLFDSLYHAFRHPFKVAFCNKLSCSKK